MRWFAVAWIGSHDARRRWGEGGERRRLALPPRSLKAYISYISVRHPWSRRTGHRGRTPPMLVHAICLGHQ